MEHHYIVSVGWQAADGVALARVFWVAVRGHDHAQSSAPVPLQLDLVELAVGTGDQQVEKVAFEAHQNRLGFRVAHAAVEFQRFDVAVGVNHQTGVQKAGKWNAIFFHAAHGGQDDFAHRPGVDVGGDHRRGRIRAHAAGVGAFVAIEQALVVLAGSQGGDVFAVAQHDEAGFFAFQKLFNHHARAAIVVRDAVFVIDQHEVHRVVGFLQRHGDDHAFARRNPPSEWRGGA